MRTWRSMIFLCLLMCGMLVPQARAQEEMVVSGAASLTNAFTELKALFENRHPGLKLHMNFAASNPLLRQMKEGAPVDVFASADQATMDKAAEAGVIHPETRRYFARNGLVLIVPKGGRHPASLEELKVFRRLAVGNPESVPAGRYAKEALENANLWQELQPQMVFGGSVRQVLDYVARGEVDAGFVYTTDALLRSDKVEHVMELAGHSPILYPIAVASVGRNPQKGQAFLDFVLSPEAGAVLAEYGFARP